MSKVDTLMAYHSNVLEEIYVFRTAGSFTFQGVLTNFYLDMVTAGLVPAEFPKNFREVVNTHADRIEMAYEHQTFGDSGFVGSLMEFSISIGANFGAAV